MRSERLVRFGRIRSWDRLNVFVRNSDDRCFLDRLLLGATDNWAFAMNGTNSAVAKKLATAAPYTCLSRSILSV